MEAWAQSSSTCVDGQLQTRNSVMAGAERSGQVFFAGERATGSGMLRRFLSRRPQLAVSDCDAIKRQQLFENPDIGAHVHRDRLYGDLFVNVSHHITGLGSGLVRHEFALCPRITTDVNEKNIQTIYPLNVCINIDA